MITVSVVLVAVSGCGDDSGEELSYGQSATVELKAGGDLEVTVKQLEKGSNADLETLEDSSSYAGKTPHYLRYTLTKTADSETDGSTEFVVSAGDSRLTRLNVMPSFDFSGDPKDPMAVTKFDKCDSLSGTDLKKAPTGQPVEGCAIYLADADVQDEPTVKWMPDSKPEVTWK